MLMVIFRITRIFYLNQDLRSAIKNSRFSPVRDRTGRELSDRTAGAGPGQRPLDQRVFPEVVKRLLYRRSVDEHLRPSG